MEKNIERRLYQKVKAIGGLALKFVSPQMSGVPDRIVLLPKGKIFFVEVKDSFTKPSPRQLKTHDMLLRLGFNVRVIDSMHGVERFICEVLENEH